MTDPTKIPTLEEIEESKAAMDDIQSFAYPTGINFIDAKGILRLTTRGLEAQYVMTAINDGVWAAGQSFTAVNQFMVFTGIAYRPKNSTTLPYVVGASPVGDSNVEVVGNLSTAQGDARYDKKLTLSQATSDAGALVGMTIRVTDRGDGLFDWVSGETANTFNIIDHDDLPLQLKLRDRNGNAILEQWGASGDGVVTAGVVEGTDDAPVINAALALRLKIVGDTTKEYVVRSATVDSDGVNEMEHVHILIDDSLDLGLGLGWNSGDNTASSTLTGADLTLSDRIIEVVSAVGMKEGQLITLKSTRLWPYDVLRLPPAVAGETQVIDSISGNFITLVAPLNDTYQLGSETVTVLTYDKIQQKLRDVTVRYGSPIEKSGMLIRFSQNPILIDVEAKNCTQVGIALSSCWMAAVARPSLIDCWKTGGTTGYGMQENNCAWSEIRGLKARGCRRAYDASGTYPTRNSLVDGFQVLGEITGTSGSGVGTHSAAQFITFSRGKVDGADIGVQIRGPGCVIDDVDCFQNPFPITLGFTLALTIKNCKEDPKVTVDTSGSLAAIPANFLDISNLPDNLSPREKLVVTNNAVTTRLGFVKINASLNDGLKYLNILNNHANVLTNSGANTLNFMTVGAAASLSESVILGNIFETNGHAGTKAFYNPLITIPTSAPNALQNVDLGIANVEKVSGAGTLVVDNAILRWESDGEYCHIFGEVEFTVSVGTVKVKVTGMQQKIDLHDLGVQVGGRFDGAWSDTLVTKDNRDDISLAFEGFRSTRDILEPFPIGVHAIPIDIKYPVRFPMN